MTFRTRSRRKAPIATETQSLFFSKAQVDPAFFNPAHQTGDRTANTATPVVQRQEGAIASPKPEEEKPVQKQAKEEEKPVQKQAKEEEKPVQKQAKEEEKPMQKQAKEEEKPVQKQDDATEKKHPQAKVTTHPGSQEGDKEQPTGLPDRLKTGIEALSGIAMDDVKVHYNSPKPDRMKALAYTQGTDIYLAPGQEQHLPHEAWHVAQQKQGRVKPTVQTKGVGVNDNPGLEQEATVMGQKANDHSAIA